MKHIFKMLLIFYVSFIGFNISVSAKEGEYIFDYTGNYQEFVVPKSGYYRVELWGAQGGNHITNTLIGGYGGYTAGTTYFKKGTTIYVYVGQRKYITKEGATFNGGQSTSGGYPSGGATDIRLVKGSTWSEFNSLKSRIMVAGGGGSANSSGATAGAGGGLSGKPGGLNNPGTQTSGGKDENNYGVGRFGISGGGAPGGGGYYGGGGAYNASGSGGGSSFISGHAGCDAILENSTEKNIIHTGQSIHYSGIKFSDTVMIDGDGYKWTTSMASTPTGMPTWDGASTMTGNAAAGHAKITFLNANVFDGLKVKDALVEATPGEENTFDVFIDSDEVTTEISADSIMNTIYLNGFGTQTLTVGKVHYITAIDEDGNLSIYKLNIKLKPFDVKISFNEFVLNFKNTILNYNGIALDYEVKNVTPVVVTPNGLTYNVRNTALRVGENQVLVDISNGTRTDTYTFNITRKEIVLPGVKTFSYNGVAQEYIVPKSGNYRIELWGAQGGNTYSGKLVGGLGAYTAGTIYLEKDTKLYFYVGQKKHATVDGATFNGGTSSSAGYPAGGATDVRLVGVGGSSAWRDFNSLKSRIMVAAGGGGGHGPSAVVGAGGGLTGKAGGWNRPGTQTAPGASQNPSSYGIAYFGIADSGHSGGNGYYPGGPSQNVAGSSGGSSFISGHDGCDAISNASTSFSNIIHTGGSVHYSGMKFNDTVMIDGDGYKWTTSMASTSTGMPTYDGTGTMTGNEGNGYAKITYLTTDNESDNNNLASITLNHGSLSPEFNKDTLEYEVILDENVTELKVDAMQEDLDASINGLGIYEIKSGEQIILLTVTSPSGKIKIYKLKVYRDASSDASLKGFKINGISYDKFEVGKNNYEIELPYNYDIVHLEAIPANSYQTITGEGVQTLTNNEATFNLLVVSEDKNNNEYYTIHFTKAKSALLKSVYFKELNKTVKLEDNKFNYDVTIPLTVHSLDISAIPYYEGANIQVIGNKYLGDTNKIVKIISSVDGLEPVTYTFNFSISNNIADVKKDFPYTGDIQEFIAPADGYYNIELWGGSGNKTAYGAYTKGKIFLLEDEKLYVYVGAKYNDTINQETFNNGISDKGGANGGGATDVRLVKGSTWYDFDSLKSRIMVAGGGGTSMNNGTPGAAGGLTGYNGGGTQGGTQTQAGARQSNTFASAGFGYASGGCTGGSGYYGGGGAWCANGAGGGSSYISGHDGSRAINETSNIDAITHKNTSEHYSGKVFTDTVMIDGKGFSWSNKKENLMLMPKPSGEYFSSGTGNNGAGYARITSANETPNDNYLDTLTVKTETREINLDFNPWTLEYEVTLDSEEINVNIAATPKDLKAMVTGTGKFDIAPNTDTKEITVTAQDGSTKIYQITFKRSASSDANPKDIEVNRMLKYLCQKNPNYCNYTFDKDTRNYTILLPYNVNEIEIKPILKSPWQKVNFKTLASDNTATNIENCNGIFNITDLEQRYLIEVISEDNSHNSEYTYTFKKDITGNNNLSNIIITNPDMTVENFFKTTYEYYLTLPKGHNSFDVKPILEREENTTITINGVSVANDALPYTVDNLKVGMNDCVIGVTAENGDRKSYILHVYKEYESDVLLSSLTVSANSENLALTPNFDARLNDYSVNVGTDVNWVDISAVASDAINTTVEGTGIKQLKAGVNKFEIKVKSTKDSSENIYNLTFYKEMDNNPNLASLTVDGYDLDKNFNKDELEYYIYLESDVTSVNVNVTMESESATYTIRGNTNLNKNVNEIVITGIAENKDYKVYKIYAVKKVSDNNFLESLTVSSGVLTPEFKKETNEYTVNVAGDTTKILVNASPEDKKSVVSGTGEYYLTSGLNTINIIVTSESAKVNTYTIKVNKALEDNLNLSEVKNNQNSTVTKIEDASLGYDYLINVQYEVNQITLEGIAESTKSTVSGNKTYSLNTGNNDITLIVTSEAGNHKDYVVRVIRDKSTNDDLSFLFVEEGGLQPDFKETTILYDVYIPNNKTEVHITAITEDKNATYEIVGDTTNLEVNTPREIKVVVTAEAGNQKTYTLNIIRQEATTNNLALLKLETNRGELSPTFNPDTLNYTLEVENEISDITITAEALSDNVTVEGVGTKSLKVGKNALSVIVRGEDGIERDYQIVVTRKKSSDATLASLVVKGHTLSPSFNKETENYTLKTSSSNLEFTTIKPSEEEATYEITGNENFTTGENIVIITVTAPDGSTTKTYSLTVTKEGSKNNNLATLEVVGYTLVPKFHKGVTFYTTDIPSNVNNVIINATAEDANATIVGTGTKVITTGENYFDVEVKSEAGTKKTYTILITKDASSNNYLASLTSSDGVWDKTFDKEINNYTITVPNDISTIEFYGTLEDSQASVIGLNEKHSLNVGNNTIVIMVTAPDGTINNYTITVIRENINSAYLTDLKVTDYELDSEFNKELFEYYINVNNETTSLDLSYVKEDSNASVTVTGNESFEVGMNEVTITVTKVVSEELTLENTYILYVNRSMSTNNYLNSLYLLETTINPDFNKETLTYTATVGSEVDSVTVVATTEDATSKITSGVGTHKLNFGKNTILVKVRSAIGITRTYTIEVTRLASSNKTLADLVLKTLDNNVVESTTSFDPGINNYTYNLTSQLDYININAYKGDDYQTINGDGTKELKSGVNTFEVVVTAGNGDINTYTLTINNPLDNNNLATMITPSSGTLSPEFTKENENYTLDLDSDVNTLEFTVTLESSKAVVSGHEIKGVPEGVSTREIIVKAEDGTEKKYTITINKEQTSNALLDTLTVKDYPFEFDSDTFTYNLSVSGSKRKLLENEITAIAKDSEATVNLMGDLELKEGIVNIYVIEVIARDGYTTEEYRLNITRDSEEHTIRSDVYNIVRDDSDEDYVIRIEPNQELETFMSNFKNNRETLKLYDKEDVEVTSINAVGTGAKVKLIIDNIVYDEVRVIVSGDTNGDGKVNVSDSMQVNNTVLKKIVLSGYQFKAGDINHDGKINVSDSMLVNNYVLKKIATLLI